MAARRNFTPKSGPLAGQFFATEYQYQKARAQALGLSGYREERQLKANPRVRAIFETERTRERFGPAGKLPAQERTRLLGVIARYKGFDPKDNRRGGSYDMYLRELGRRTGNESWLPGETP